jgi:hypothetical protein
MQIFELCQRLEDHLRTLRESSPDRETQELLSVINSHLEEFPFLAVLGPWRVHPFVWWRRAPDRHPRRDAQPLAGKRLSEMATPVFHLDIVRLVLNMTEAGTVGRIRKCVCGTWFFAQTNKKRVCSDACRFRKFNSEHANYMRRYREILKSGRAKKQTRKG